MKKILAGAAIALSVAAVPAQAGEVLLNFGTTGGTNGPNGTKVWSAGTGADAFQVTASAWTVSTRNNSTTVYNSQLGQWGGGSNNSPSAGLGVINDWESGSSPTHTIDNSSDGNRKNTDFILLQFNREVNLSQVFLNGDPYGDTDFSIAYGNIGGAPAWDGKAWTSSSNPFSGLNFVHRPQSGDADVNKWYTTGVNNNVYSTTWVVSALFPTATAPDKYADAFKLSAMKVIAPVPEPGTWALMILGFGFVGASMRRRKGQTDGALRLA